MQERDYDSEEVEALISLCIERCSFEFYHVPETKFMNCYCITPTRVVLCTGYAQRMEGEFIWEVAREYSVQNCRNAAREVLRKAKREDLLKIVNFAG